MTHLTADELTTLDEAWRTGSFVTLLDAVEGMVDAHRDEAVVMADIEATNPDPEPQPSDGPDYHTDHAWWRDRQRRRANSHCDCRGGPHGGYTCETCR